MLVETIQNLLPETLLTSTWMRWAFTGMYVLLLALSAPYGIHRYWLVWLYYRHRRKVSRPASSIGEAGDLPRVTVQLPMYNEAAVAARVIDACASMDWPRDRLQIQVIDDSTDHGRQIAAARVRYWHARGVDIQHVTREGRRGFKAGALDAAMPSATGEFIAIFDADFIPPARFLRRTLNHFSDPGVGVVQTRWDHLNRNDSLLTRGQAMFLDGHFVIEHVARHTSGRWIHFNGTAGVWRRQAIDDAGGWHADTLTEDVDLSYRAQLAGWRFVYLPRVVCPAELPPEIDAFKAQQHRWTKGAMQVAVKLLPTIFCAKVPLKVKLEAFFHLTSRMTNVYLVLMAVLFLPAFFVNIDPFQQNSAPAIIWALTIFFVGTASSGAYYLASQRALGRSWWSSLLELPLTTSLGAGIAINNTRAVLEALLGHQSDFIRTPKYNAAAPAGDDAIERASETTLGDAIDEHRAAAQAVNHIDVVSQQEPAKLSRRSRTGHIITACEITMGLYCLLCTLLAIQTPATLLGAPFLMMFAAGFLYVGGSSLARVIRPSRPVVQSESRPEPRLESRPVSGPEPEPANG